jgi:hypothetical protein
MTAQSARGDHEAVSIVTSRCMIRSKVSPDRFVPKGAIAFFAAMIVFYGAVWLLLMAVMVARG